MKYRGLQEDFVLKSKNPHCILYPSSGIVIMTLVPLGQRAYFWPEWTLSVGVLSTSAEQVLYTFELEGRSARCALPKEPSLSKVQL